MWHFRSVLWGTIVILLLGFIVATPDMSGAVSLELAKEEAEAHPGTKSWDLPADSGFESEAQLLAVNSAGAEDRQEMLELLAVLEEETKVATKTKMNGDYVPGMVTVLQGEHLEALGIQTVAEALAMVPGIQSSRVFSGEPSVKVRGIAFPFNAGNIKVMLNSIALSRESSGIDSSVLLIPVAQVDRIEVIRGPGSSLYGDFALTGVVNIITKNNGGRLFMKGGDDESIGGGGYYNYRNETDSFGVGLNVSMFDDGENTAVLGSDPDGERFAGVFKLDYKGFTLTAEGVRRDIEMVNVLRPDDAPPDPSPNREAITEESWAVEGRHSLELSPNLGLETYLSYLRNSRDSGLPPGEFMGDRVEAGLDVNWSPWSGHQLLFGLSYTYSDIDDAYQQPGIGSPTEISGVDRRSYSLSVQDLLTLSDRLSLTLGFRYDDYDDVGDILTPRIACVYRLGEHHVLKAQYSEGFRAPTFWELYITGQANESLDFEVIKTGELAYVYRRPKAVGRLTLYYSKIDDALFQSPEGDYGNIAEIDSKGVEVEWEQQLGEKFRWLANISYVDARDERSGETADNQPLGVADWLGNLAIFFQPFPNLTVTGRLLHVGDRHATDGWIDGYDTVDFTVSLMDLLIKGATIRAGVKNIFDDEIIYLRSLPNRLSESEFVGRAFWLQLSYDF